VSAAAGNAGETDQEPRKATVMQATIGVGLLICCVIVIAVLTRQTGNSLAAFPSREAPVIPDARRDADAFREAAEREALMQGRLRPETQGRRGDAPRDSSRSFDDGMPPEAIDRILEAIGAGGEDPTRSGSRAGPIASSPSPQAERIDDAAFAGLACTVCAADGRGVESAGAGRAGGAAGARLRPGTVIEATLTQELNSDFPGAPWKAQVDRDVMLADGRIGIAAGSLILGTAGSHTGPNAILQGRMPLNAEMIVRTDGVEIPLQVAVLDAAGMAAVPGPTDRHVVAQAGGVLAYALIGASGAATANSDPVSTDAQFRQQAVAGAGQQVSPLAQRYLQVQPTVRPPRATPMRLVLSAGLDLPSPQDV
jgi:hypothetical protein